MRLTATDSPPPSSSNGPSPTACALLCAALLCSAPLRSIQYNPGTHCTISVDVTWARHDLDGWSSSSHVGRSNLLAHSHWADGVLCRAPHVPGTAPPSPTPPPVPGMRPLIAICRKCKCKCPPPLFARSHPPPTFLCDCNLSIMILPRPRVIAAANIPWPVCMIPSVSLCGPGRLQCTLSMTLPCRLLVLLDLAAPVRSVPNVGTSKRGAGSRPPNDVTGRVRFPMRWRLTNLDWGAAMAKFGSWPHVRSLIPDRIGRWRNGRAGERNCECHGLLNPNHCCQMLVRGK
ncbi:uncharacterized protein J3D65DRAFT_28784 [Phyllosticta citribraziliensis]|uniref:Uncharacterized protein n=1 Tax=Phyllosticta citribraziliensis TaxID=989973 RepID=A0ABR1M9U1_9PEZI